VAASAALRAESRLKDGHLAGFEEAAALMGETSATKYQRAFGTMIDVLVEFIAPNGRTSARSTLVKALVLNHLLGNGDAHLKNFGVLYEDAAHVAPIYDCVSTLPYLPNDVPALVLSFEWYSKAWWPRVQIEEFAVEYGWLSRAAIRRMFDEAFEAVLGGVKRVTRYGREIAGLADLADRMATLWTARVDAFSAEETGLTTQRSRKKP